MQGTIAAALKAFDPSATADVAVVGCGPAGLALAAELAKLGLQVALVGRDVPFVNNYGVWLDEFEALGLVHTLDARELPLHGRGAAGEEHGVMACKSCSGAFVGVYMALVTDRVWCRSCASASRRASQGGAGGASLSPPPLL